ncbi:histidine kinase [Halobacteriales archaeon SW_5_68_122]|nr:MAG: histidine kinase [Halobacteriales archaeon SW_5_68_122]
MSTAENARATGTASGSWEAGTVGGIVGAAVMGALIVLMNEAVIAVAIPSLYTLAPPQNPAAGLFVHVSHGAVLGVVFAGIAGAVGADSTGKLLGLGALWGVVTWVVLAALVMPVWLGAVGSPASPPLPNFAPPSLLWHVVYGVVLGGVYAGLADRF